MADTILSPLLEALSEKLFSLLGSAIKDNDNKRELEKLLIILEKLQEEVLRLEHQPLDRKVVKYLLEEVQEVAYDVDDLLDISSSSSSSSWLPNKVSNIFFFFYHFKNSPLKKIQDIREVLDYFLERLNFYNYVSSSLEEELHAKKQKTWLEDSEFYVRVDEKEEIIARLFTDHEERVSVIPIVGMGGIGKSTLARMAYNDGRVINHFELRVWVDVPQDFHVSTIAKMVIESTTGNKHDSVDHLEDGLLHVLSGKRCLIVLDDVWSEDHVKWNKLKSLLGKCIWGSKVIVTTRNKKIAEMMGTVIALHLDILSDDDSWSLFKHQVFMPGEETPKLVEIGKKLVKKCKGFPIEAKYLGYEMYAQTSNSKWMRAIDDEYWNFKIYHRYILPYLMLSYNRLSAHLKQCFAYCSIFPKDYTIKKEKLIQLWMAEGFIQSSKGGKALEEIGNDYFMDLSSRLFFKDVKQDDYGNIIECKMHDFIHDLAQSVARIGCTIVEAAVVENISEKVRHSSLVCTSTSSTFPEAFYKAKKLRTLLVLYAKNFKRIPGNMFLCFRSLRVLDLSRTGIVKLAASIGTLKHLRYLDLSHTPIETLPESITSLKYLQTLKLLECYRLEELPKDLREMTNLRHLDISLCHSLSHMPSGIGQLSCLRTLPLFIVSKKTPYSLRELYGLNLGGELEIKNLGHLVYNTNAFDANLKEKQNLRSLRLSWDRNIEVFVDGLAEVYADNVFEDLQPHPNLRELHIEDYKGFSFPTWLNGSVLLNLVKVSITNCGSCEHLPPLGQLPYLRDLYVKGMIAVMSIGYEFYGDGFVRGFPSLKRLEIYNMPNLVEWFDLTELDSQLNLIATETFPCLDTLILEGCPKLTSLPPFPVLTDLALWNSNEMMLCSLDNLTSLSSLVVNEFGELRALPKQFGNLKSVKKLTIYCCNRLLCLSEEGMQGLTSLQHLSILYCNKLIFLHMGLRYLRALLKLDIKECQELAFLPEVMEHVPILKELIIDGCPKLVSLPNDMQYLTFLQKLIIKRCPNLVQLPTGFEHIYALQYLVICECPLLEKRLEKGKGEDWWKIAHIPSISINNRYIDQ